MGLLYYTIHYSTNSINEVYVFSIRWFLLRFDEYPRPSDSTEFAEAVPIDFEFVMAVVEPLILLKYVPYTSSSIN